MWTCQQLVADNRERKTIANISISVHRAQWFDQVDVPRGIITKQGVKRSNDYVPLHVNLLHIRETLIKTSQTNLLSPFFFRCDHLEAIVLLPNEWIIVVVVVVVIVVAVVGARERLFFPAGH